MTLQIYFQKTLPLFDAISCDMSEQFEGLGDE